MKRTMRQRIYLLALILTLSAVQISPIMAEEASSGDPAVEVTAPPVIEQTKTSVIGTVQIGNNNSISIEEVAMLPSDEGNVVTFTLNVKNGSDRDLQFIDYWVRLQSKSGLQYSVTLMPQDREKNKIPASTNQELRFYSTVSTSVGLEDLQFKIIEWDFDLSSFERVLGTITVPEGFSNVTPVFGNKTISVAGTPLQTKITKVTMNRNDKYNLPTIYFHMENMGSKSAELPNYEFFIRTSEGLLYPLNATGLSRESVIYPRFVKEFQLNATLPIEVSTDDWQLLVTVKDDAAKLNLPTAFYALPAPNTGEDTGVTPVRRVKVLEVDGHSLDTSVKRLLTNKTDKYYENTITFEMKNMSVESISVPRYQFSIKTSDGLTYPVTAENFDNVKVDPQVNREVQLRVSIPVEVSMEKAQLIVSLPPAEGQDSNKGLPIAYYELPLSNQDYIEGGSAEFSNKDGLYSVRLNHIQRLPWEDRDILTASLTISNPAANSLPVPDLTGKFVLDEKVEVPLSSILLDNVLGINRNGEVSWQLYGDIPYTYEFTTMRLVLEEKLEDKPNNNLLEFMHDTEIVDPKYIHTDQVYYTEGLGRRLGIYVQELRTWENLDANLVTVLLNVQNMERRDTAVPPLVAHFKTPDGIVYPAKISEVKNKLGPRSVATLYVTSAVPDDYDPEKLELVLGEGVGGSNESIAAYVNAATFLLPFENKFVKSDFNRMNLFPYTVTLENFKSELLSTSQFRLAFDYQVSKSLLVDSGMDDHHLVIEFKDPQGSLHYSQVLSLGREDGLKLGYGTKEFIITDPSVLLKLPYLENYEINVYDEYQGMRKLIASETTRWF